MDLLVLPTIGRHVIIIIVIIIVIINYFTLFKTTEGTLFVVCEIIQFGGWVGGNVLPENF